MSYLKHTLAYYGVPRRRHLSPTAAMMRRQDRRAISAILGYLLNRSCPAQRVALGGSDLAELNQRPGPMTFSHRSCSTYVNSPDGPLSCPPDGGARALGDGRNRCFNPGAPCPLRPGFVHCLGCRWPVPRICHTRLVLCQTPATRLWPGSPALLGRPGAVTQPAPVLCGSP